MQRRRVCYGPNATFASSTFRTPSLHSPSSFSASYCDEDRWQDSSESAAGASSFQQGSFEDGCGDEHGSEPGVAAWRKRDTGADEAVNETAQSSFSEINLMDLNPQLRRSWSSTRWTEGKRFNSSMTIFGVRAQVSQQLCDAGKRGIDACLIYLRTKMNGHYQLYSRRQDGGSRPVEVLRDIGHCSSLLAACVAAFDGSPQNIEIPGGSKGDVGKERPSLCLLEDADGVRLASGHCVADSCFNVLKDCYPGLVLKPFTELGVNGVAIDCQDLGILLRLRTSDDEGYSTIDKLVNVVCQSNDFPFDLAHVTDRAFPGINQGGPIYKRDRLIELSKQGHKFVLQCHRHGDFSSTNHVGLADGVVYDNDASTGGKIDAIEFSKQYMAGVKKAVAILPRPPSSRRRRKKKRKRANKAEVSEKKPRIAYSC